MRRRVVETPPPVPDLRPTDGMGLAFSGWTAASTAAGWWLATRASLLPWAAGQAVLAGAFLQSFTLLHGCGHGTLFRTRRLNDVVGTVVGFFALIPFGCWKPIHARHHEWTGWQDLDPTTAALAPRPLGRLERLAVNVCWLYWIPIFSILHRADNYWNLLRLFRLLEPKPDEARAMVIDAAALVAICTVLVFTLGPAAFVRSAGPALLLTLMVEDVLLLSQHTHMPCTSAAAGTWSRTERRLRGRSRGRPGCRRGCRRCSCTSTPTSYATGISRFPATGCGKSGTRYKKR